MWYAALAFVTLTLFTAAVGAVAFMGLFYTDPEACLLNKVFLGVNASLCLIVSMLAISPCIQKRKGLARAPAFFSMFLSDALHFSTGSVSLQCNPPQASCSRESSACM